MNVVDTEPLFVDAPQEDLSKLSQPPNKLDTKMEKNEDKDCIPMNTNVPSAHSTMQPPHPVGPSNTVTQCPYCQATVKTSIKHTATTRTHIISLMCCAFCCCCCIPYCMDSTRNTDHYCPLCDRYLGTYQK